MRQLTSIIARAENGAIGARNRLPWRVRSDMQFFRRTTVDHVVVMGKRTYGSLAGCLPDRHNVVVTHRFELFPEGPTCEAAGGIEEALFRSSRAAGRSKDVFVIGGATMYEQFAPLVDRYLITNIRMLVPDADTFFDPTVLGDPDQWLRTVLESGKADGARDEADFEIVELISKNAAEVAARRDKILNRWQDRIPVKPRASRQATSSSRMDLLPL